MPSAVPKRPRDMAASSAAPAAGVSAGATAAGKRKRPRKSKKRTTEVVSDSSDDDDDSSDDEEPEKGKTPTVQPVKKLSNKEDADSDSDSSSSSSSSSSDSESEEEEEQKGRDTQASKRKRKRKRASDKKNDSKDGTENDKSQSAAAVASNGSSGTAEVATREQIEALGEPEEDAALGEAAKRALEYARQYHLDRASWKFNKARQLWLIRHALSLPVEGSEEAAAESKTAEEGSKPAENKDEDEEDAEIAPFWTEKWTPLAGSYLATVQGAAKQRLIGSLREAASAEIPSVPEPSNGDSSSDPTSETNVENRDTKSVSFGDLAMTTEANEEAAAAKEGITETDTGVLREQAALATRRKARAQHLLQAMGESQI